MYEAIVFDVDGVLLQQPPEHPAEYREAIADTFRAFDVDPAEVDLEPFYGEDKDVETMRAECERLGLDLEEVWPERERQASALQREMIRDGRRTLFEDAEVLREVASDHRVALVSNNQIATIEFLVEHYDLADHVDAVRARTPSVEGLTRGKPDPHYVQRALDDIGTDDAIKVGDRATDLVAAERAGLDSAFVRRGRAEMALESPPTYDVDDLWAFRDLLREGAAGD